MQGSALYNPRANATASQLREADNRRARLQRIGDLAKPDGGMIRLSSSPVSGAPAAAAPLAPPKKPLDSECSALNPNFTFETFAAGRSNSLAVAAVRQVVEWDVMPFSPLYIHSRSGLGKTHLLQAMCHGRPITYMTATRFSDFVIGKSADEAFAATRIVVIDDIHCLRGKAAIDAVNELVDSAKRLVVASDRSPLEMEEFGDRLRTRLGGGLVVEIAGFSDDIRAQVVRNRVDAATARKPSFLLDQPSINFIADVVSDGRHIDGAINRLFAYHSLHGATITLDVVERELSDIVKQTDDLRRVKIYEIQRAVGRRYGVTASDICSARRTANIVKPRQLAMYLSKVLTLKSLPEIGRRFGKRDHTTILHSVRKMERLMAGDQSLAQEIDDIKLELASR